MLRRWVAVAGLVAIGCGADPGRAADAPCLKVLGQFTAADVPRVGAKEVGPTTRSWGGSAAVPDGLPGNGIAEHPMLYAGEGYNTLFVVVGGKVVWTYSSGPGGEIDDVWMLSNGHILYSRMSFLEEVTPRKEVVWHYDAPAGTEIHTCQPIGLDKVLFVKNALPPKAVIVSKKTGEVEMEHALPAISETDPKTVHAQFRRFRMTREGTYLAPHLNMGKVVEYDKEFKEIWSYSIPSPWSAVRLHNGNTLINDEKDRLVREVNKAGETVWEWKQSSDLPAGLVQRNNQTADRLASGNTIICSSTGGLKGEEKRKAVQVIGVSPEKKVVWVLQDWRELGPATTAQLLDEPGVPEEVGALQR